MRHLSLLILLFAVIALTLSSCGSQDDPIMAGDSGRQLPPASSTVIATTNPSNLLNGYLVEFDGRTYAGDQTTFSYTVTGQGADHALSNFGLEVPDCAPEVASFSPPGAVINVDPNSGLYSVRWNLSLGTSESRSYSVTYPGDVRLGVILTTVKAATLVETGDIAGPCKGFEISGTVYVDADSNGVKDGAGESGISNVSVALEDGAGNVEIAVTDADGNYDFFKSAGTYTIRIDAATTADDFNEELFESFDATGPNTKSVTVGPGSLGNNFGFDPQTEEIIVKIDDGTLLTNGEPPKFWEREMRSAINGGKGKSEFDLATMEQFVAELQGLFLVEPFQFTPGNEFQEALAILSTNSKDPLDLLLMELLAAELNHLSGKGLVGAASLQSVLLSWAESLVVLATAGPTPVSKRDGGPQRVVTVSDLGGATDLLVRMNGSKSTGGGSGGGG